MTVPFRSIGLASALCVGGTVLAGPVLAQERGVIKGVVVNFDSQPLDQANVEIFGVRRTQVTNATGEFRIGSGSGVSAMPHSPSASACRATANEIFGSS